nr:unnamed protein product [Callosobruchus chinensis]
MLKKGTLVLLKDDHTLPTEWRRGSIIRLSQGPDSIPRLAEIKTRSVLEYYERRSKCSTGTLDHQKHLAKSNIARKCEVCDVDIRRGSAKVKCSNVTCDVTLHQKCFSSIAKVIKLEKSEWLCKNCDEESDTSTTAVVTSGDEDVVRELATVKCDVLNELRSSNKLLLVKIEQLTSNRSSDVHTRQNIDPPIPYSHVVSKNMYNYSKSTVKANVNPAAEKIAINGTKLIKNGILINCSNEESLEKLKSAVEAMFSNKYKIATPKPFKPRLLVSDVEKSLENRNDFRESLVQNNTFLEDCDIKVIAVIKLKYSINFIILKLIQMCENR